MFVRSTLLALVLALGAPAGAVWAGDGAGLQVMDAYARSSTAMSKSGAAFFMVMNETDEEDRLIGASTPLAARTMLHTHVEEDGVMRMVHVDGGFAVPAGGTLMLKRGGDHVMFMGLTGPLQQGDIVPLTLVFEKAGEKVIEVPVDLERQADHSGHSDHGSGS